MSENEIGLLVIGGILAFSILLGAVASLLTKLSYAAIIGGYYRRTGKKPYCLHEKLARQVAREFAEEAVNAREAEGGMEAGPRKEAVENMALLAHKFIVDYAYRYSTSLATLRP